MNNVFYCSQYVTYMAPFNILLGTIVGIGGLVMVYVVPEFKVSEVTSNDSIIIQHISVCDCIRYDIIYVLI